MDWRRCLAIVALGSQVFGACSGTPETASVDRTLSSPPRAPEAAPVCEQVGTSSWAYCAAARGCCPGGTTCGAMGCLFPAKPAELCGAGFGYGEWIDCGLQAGCCPRDTVCDVSGGVTRCLLVPEPTTCAVPCADGMTCCPAGSTCAGTAQCFVASVVPGSCSAGQDWCGSAYCCDTGSSCSANCSSLCPPGTTNGAGASDCCPPGFSPGVVGGTVGCVADAAPLPPSSGCPAGAIACGSACYPDKYGATCASDGTCPIDPSQVPSKICPSNEDTCPGGGCCPKGMCGPSGNCVTQPNTIGPSCGDGVCLAGGSPSLCTQAGTCCPASAPNDCGGTCCDDAHPCCGDTCCADGLACVDGQCACPGDHPVACGSSCCLPGASCTPTGCGCPDGRVLCAGTCCGAGQVCHCGSTCEASSGNQGCGIGDCPSTGGFE